MNRTILAFLVVTLSYQAALAGKYVIDEGESGDPEAYLEVDRDRQLVVMGCSVTNGNFNFGVAMPINNPAPGSMLHGSSAAQVPMNTSGRATLPAYAG